MTSWLGAATLAQIILGTSAVFDRLLLRKRTIEPVAYTFWLAILGAFAAFLIPFGVTVPAAPVLALALLSGALFVAGMFSYYWALERTQVSETAPIVAALSPLATALAGVVLLHEGMGALGIIGFSFLVAASSLFFLAERPTARTLFFRSVLAGALLFGVSNVTAKLVFEATNFVTGFFWIKVGGVIVALGAFGLARTRRLLRDARADVLPVRRTAYFLNRGYAAAGSLLGAYAISLTHPALVDATQGLRYVAIFVVAWILVHERPRGWMLSGKIAATGLVIIGLAWLALGEYARSLPPVDQRRPIVWGVTFSPKFSRELGLDWRENFTAMLDDLKPARLRLVAYWDELEPDDNRFDFAALDWQIAEAERRGISYILAVGLKTPRWPECHIPAWAAARDSTDQEAALHGFLSAVVARYRDTRGFAAWQVENEPFLRFGECRHPGAAFLDREIALVRSLDPSRQIITTDGGEFGDWVRAVRRGDAFGTTMYRRAYPRLIGSLFGTIEYPLDSSYFRVKERFVRWLDDTPDKRFVVIELQGEPWEPRSLASVPPGELVAAFSPEYFRETIAYAKATGFEEYYLWGVEWWWRMKAEHDISDYWGIVRELFHEG